ncbi:MAG: UDP-N-acetylglucosamine 2-epimerase (hydrolyzing) [Candidatus Brocadiales bacterium]|nr:UDP-N-acetylglucosamine 2-epimerase (hydrolyzing) [Candidatus Bathyanammoxibius sp.]
MTYGYSRPVVRMIEEDPDLRYSLIVTNQHLLPAFGYTIEEIEEDGLNVTDRIYMTLDGYTPATMTKSLGVFLLGVTDALVRLKPDIILVVGDRGEHLMAAMAGAHMNIPVAHIQAGELSGNIDGMTRHAITRFAHIHFASNQDAADRLLQMGEQEFRIFLTGAPQLDELINGAFASPEEVAGIIQLDLNEPVILVVQHPVTEEFGDTVFQIQETLEAVCSFDLQTVLMFPNNDAGSEHARRIIERYRRPHIKIERNVPRYIFAGLMNVASVMVGNSSSGLIEAPYFKLPAVNVGNRQRDRMRGNNVIDVPYDRARIRAGIEKALSEELQKEMETNCENPYFGDGLVSERIVRILKSIETTEDLLKKQIAY